MGTLINGSVTLLGLAMGAVIVVQLIIWGALMLFDILFGWIPAAGYEIEDY